ncbi:hypothetical protein ONZ45_g4737 [Pleurotus djamor]|nr:hypothetical protein ONZ45_g4737 [Pleurotus djamor]
MADATSTPTTPSTRFVPGAPPPQPLSKSQKKRRAKGPKSENAPESPVIITDTTSAALVEKAPEPEEVREGSLAPELVAQPEAPQPATPLPEEEAVLKNSPIVELVNKRLKATNKKIQRIATYAATDADKLNDDQKRTLKTLPTLEAVQKELGEVKKVIEVYESELAHELASKRLETEKAEKARIAAAAADAQRATVAKTSDLITLLRIRSLLSSADPEVLGLGVQAQEADALFALSDALLGSTGDVKQSVLDGYFSGVGDFDGVPYSRFSELVQLYTNPPRAPTPEPVPSPEAENGDVASEPEVADDLAVSGVTVTVGAISTSGSFHFMQESELEGPTFEETAEWVESSDAVEAPVEVPEQAPPAPETNGHAVTNGSVPVQSNGNSLDWAADDTGDLPPIDGFQATYGTSGSATPDAVEQSSAAEPAAEALTTNGHVPVAESTPAAEDDGFTQARGSRGFRGRGSGFRGGERGGYRGGDRGGFRGYRGGDRGFRGGHRGERGGFRGGRGPPSHAQAPSTPAPA